MENIATLKGMKCPKCGSENVRPIWIKGAYIASYVNQSVLGTRLGDLVTSQTAMANKPADPIQYLCNGCKKSFKSLPLVAPPEDVLAEPCTISFTRVKAGKRYPQHVFLNGEIVALAKKGETKTFTTHNRYNTIFVTDNSSVVYKDNYVFEAEPGGSVSLTFKRKFL